MNILKEKISEDPFKKEEKKYNKNEWKNVYHKRYLSFIEKLNIKNDEIRKNEHENGNKEKDNELILSPSKKTSSYLIHKSCERLYNEAQKREIKRKIRIKNQRNISQIQAKTLEESLDKYIKTIKNINYNFKEDEYKKNIYNFKINLRDDNDNNETILSSNKMNEKKLNKKTMCNIHRRKNTGKKHHIKIFIIINIKKIKKEVFF